MGTYLRGACYTVLHSEHLQLSLGSLMVAFLYWTGSYINKSWWCLPSTWNFLCKTL